jgi:hypothetical protein
MHNNDISGFRRNGIYWSFYQCAAKSSGNIINIFLMVVY